MREIKFRGIRERNAGEQEVMIFGRLNNIYPDTPFIWPSPGVGYGVRPETVGQYTGLKDKNDREIYEGDILKRHFEVGREVFDPVSGGFIDYEIDDEGYFVGLVSYRPSGGFILNQCKKFDPEGNFLLKRSGVKIHSQYAEVIGNIHENPELLNS